MSVLTVGVNCKNNVILTTPQQIISSVAGSSTRVHSLFKKAGTAGLLIVPGGFVTSDKSKGFQNTLYSNDISYTFIHCLNM